MCITTSEADLSKTVVYGGRAVHEGKNVHVLAYQNKAESFSGPNAMFLPIPSDIPMTSKNLVDTSKFPDFLDDIAYASKNSRLARGLDHDSFAGDVGIAEVFDVGSYTVIIASNLKQVPEALERVPEKRRPAFSDAFLRGMQGLYPSDQVLICCFDGSIEAEPILCWYVPRNEDRIFIPTMDAHNGGSPNLEVRVRTDHKILTGHFSAAKTYNRVEYTSEIPEEVKHLLPEFSNGLYWGRYSKNNDSFVHFLPDSVYPVLIRGDETEVMSGWS